MKTRYFSLFEKVRIFYSNFFMIIGTILTIISLLSTTIAYSSISGNTDIMMPILMSIFPLISLAILAYGIKKSSQNLDVLENGEIALGKFLRSEATNTTINKQRVMKMYFSFTDKYGKEQQTSINTHHTHKLQDEALEMLVYMPDNVVKSVFLDILPSFVRERLEPEFTKLKSKSL